MRTEDGNLIYRCLNGEKDAFGFLVDKYRESVYATAYGILRNFHDAQDAAQEAFIRAYENLHTLRRWERFSFWLYRITVNICKRSKDNESRRADRESIENVDGEGADVRAIASYRETLLYDSLSDALEAIPEIHRTVLTLQNFNGMTSSEIAGFVGASPEAVRKRLSKAREMLKAEMLEIMKDASKEQKLEAGFTLQVLEMVKHIRVQPLPRIAELGWGVSIATGIMIIFLGMGAFIQLQKWENPDSAASEVTGSAGIGEIPVDMVEPEVSEQKGDASMLNNKMSVAVATIAVLSVLSGNVMAQTEWTKYSDSPVLEIGDSGEWDDRTLYDSAIFIKPMAMPGDLEKYQMWYGGRGYNDSNVRIGRATSPDGKDWTKHGKVKTLVNGVPIDDGLLGASGAWDDRSVLVACVLFNDGKYKMWYSASDDYNNPVIRIGYATSLDGINWTKHGKVKTLIDNVPIDNGLLGPSGAWDSMYVYEPTVIFDPDAIPEERYKMWYQGAYYGYSEIGYATSSDGIEWSKHNNPANDDESLYAESDPVLHVGPTGAWDSSQLLLPCVLFHSGEYEMWYTGYSNCLDYAVGYATSTDGIYWTKFNDPDTNSLCFLESDSVISRSPGSWDSHSLYRGRVIIEGDSYKMWYTGQSPGGPGEIGYATSIIPGRPEDAFVVLAENSVYVKEHATILNGLVGVNENDMQGPYLADSELTVGIGVVTEDEVDLSATNIRLKMNATVQGDVVYCQEIVMGDGATIGGEQIQNCDSFPLLTMPSPPVVVPGTDYVEVSQGGYLQLPGGDYGDIMVRKNGTLVLTGDVYNIKSFDTGDLAKIYFTMAATVNIADKFDTDQSVYFGPEPGNTSLTADDIIINVCGINGSKGNLGSTPKSAQIGLNNTFYGRMYALNGTVYIRQNTHAVGSFIGKDVIVGETTVISREGEGALAAPPLVANMEHKAVKSSPASYLGQCYPNPFNPETWIPFELGRNSDVTIRIYNASGGLVRTLSLGSKTPGFYTSKDKAAYWDGKNEAGEMVSSGVYFYSIEAGDFTATRKMAVKK